MFTSLSSRVFVASSQDGSKPGARKATELEAMASLLDTLVPKFKSESDRQFYREVAESYRAAAHEILLRNDRVD
jgi:hypothetical protein